MRKVDKIFWISFVAMIASMLAFGWATGLIQYGMDEWR